MSKSVGQKEDAQHRLLYEELHETYPSTHNLVYPLSKVEIVVNSGKPLEGSFIMALVRFAKGETTKAGKVRTVRCSYE